MGDNMTDLFVMLELYLVLANWPRWSPSAFHGRAVALLWVVGLVMGLGTGLKLTNAPYAVALCLALLVLDGGLWHRIRLAFVYGVGVLAGVAASAGYWFWIMWHSFGNPLFPQFNALFRSPYALQSGVLDLDHVPRSLSEALLWPFVFTRDFHRVSELVLKQCIWPIVYVLFLALGARMLWQGLRRGGAVPLAPRQGFVMLFFALGYAGWVKLFGIYRYLVPLELIAPLMVWLLLHALLKAPAARVAGRWVLLLAAVVVFPFGTWGHTHWARESFRVSDPGIADPAASVIYTPIVHPPMGWMVKYLPPQVPVLTIGEGFPETPDYVAKVRAIAASRHGPHYVMLEAHTRHEEDALERKRGIARKLGLMSHGWSCALLKKLRIHADVLETPADAAERCQLVLQAQYQIDPEAMDRAVVATAGGLLGRYGITIDAASCRRHAAYVGTEARPYQLCRVNDGL